MQKTIAALLGITTVALLGVCISQHRELQNLRKDAGTGASRAPVVAVTPALPQAPRPSPRMPDKERANYDRTISDLQSRLQSATAAPSASNAAAPSIAAPSGVSTNMAAQFAGIAKMIKNPAMKKMIRAQQQATLDTTHGSLFKGLTLSAADMDTFKELLLDKQMAMMDASLDMMEGGLTPEQLKEKTKQMKDITTGFDEKIKALLGDDGFALYKDYEDTQPERMQINFFKQALAEGDQIDASTEHNLIRAMYEERTNFPFTVNLGKQENTDPTLFTEDKIAKYLQEAGQLEQKCLTRASGMLSAAQVEQFKRSQEQQRAMQEMGLRMAAQMFGQGTAARTGDGGAR